MKAQELRLGNWILDIAGNPVQARGLTKNGVWIGPGPAPVSAFKPVPLTEEWLLKFGFEDNSYARFYKYVGNEFYITVSFKDYAHTQLSEHPVEVNDYSLPLDCKYVHQLQNLFHSITGEELTIKE